jgi:hypothetical protein
VTLKNSNTRFVREPFKSATMSLYSFGNTGPRMNRHAPLLFSSSALRNNK